MPRWAVSVVPKQTGGLMRVGIRLRYLLVMVRQLSISQLIKQAQLLGRVAFDEAIHRHGLTISQYGVLWRLAEYPGISGAELAREMAMTPQATQETLRWLESNGLICRIAAPRDRRALRLHLTDIGEHSLDQCRPTMAAVETDALRSFTADERRQFRNLLKQYIETMQGRG